jgi:hypothetical protein
VRYVHLAKSKLNKTETASVVYIVHRGIAQGAKDGAATHPQTCCVGVLGRNGQRITEL